MANVVFRLIGHGEDDAWGGRVGMVTIVLRW